MKQRTIQRLEALETAHKADNRIPVPLFSCIVDGEEQELTALDFAYAVSTGHSGTMGAKCGITYWETSEATTEERLKKMDDFIKQAEEEYNSPEAEAKRKADYEELCRIGELRAQDFYAGRDMDKCHPLPWQKS